MVPSSAAAASSSGSACPYSSTEAAVAQHTTACTVASDFPAPLSAEAMVARWSCHACRAAASGPAVYVSSERSVLRASSGMKGRWSPVGEKAGQTPRDAGGHGRAMSHASHAVGKFSGLVGSYAYHMKRPIHF